MKIYRVTRLRRSECSVCESLMGYFSTLEKAKIAEEKEYEKIPRGALTDGWEYFDVEISEIEVK